MYLGDFPEDAEVVFYWNTNDGDGASITRATNGTIKVRRDDGTDCTGTSITDTEDTPDVGIHQCKVATSDSANFAIGYDYVVWLDGAVIDGETVNAALAHFSIENRFVEVDVTKLGGAAQSATDLKDFADTGYNPATHKVAGVVLTDTCTTNTDMRGTNSAALAATALSTATWTAARAGYLDELAAANIPADLDAVLEDTGTTLPATLTTLSGYVDVIDDGTSGLVKIAADVAAVLVDTGTTLPATLGTSGVVLASSEDVYWGKISFFSDNANAQDEYEVVWYKNGAPVTSGITTPTIQVIKRADGSDLVGEASMTQVGSTGAYKYDSTTRHTAGEALLVVCQATIDGSERECREWVGRDDG